MLILNHPLISPLNLRIVSSKNAIENSLPSDFLILQCQSFEELLNLANFCKENRVSFSVIPTNIKEALLLVNLNARFLLTKDLTFASTLQKLAEIYLFDTKILFCIQDENAIESTANYGIDGVIFASI
ncbi:hypothetical protein LS70_004245 [Helicobacter sp. MIT 11-5569]|uniref:hypothetical protein n=1 Tax=Helicobacter sp. MIT 11-5569 TaxID=1548151 RepID=UPI00051FE302|nr:hypothetical protein [Helicobacter sp. MIT 11-5569]TLD84023.1 hypothetical protein LS70_004245 [Helicobacter sp. MIT 11-5569]